MEAPCKNLVIPPGTEFTPQYRSNLLGGVTVVTETTTALFRTAENAVISVPFKVTAVPYYANANRGTCPMQVWMPEREEDCRPEKQE